MNSTRAAQTIIQPLWPGPGIRFPDGGATLVMYASRSLTRASRSGVAPSAAIAGEATRNMIAANNHDHIKFYSFRASGDDTFRGYDFCPEPDRFARAQGALVNVRRCYVTVSELFRRSVLLVLVVDQALNLSLWGRFREPDLVEVSGMTHA